MRGKVLLRKAVHESITATALQRGASSAIDKVRMSGRSVYITKGSQIVAELCPPPKSGYPIDRLPELFKSLPTLGKDNAAMAKDLETIRKIAKLPGNPWD